MSLIPSESYSFPDDFVQTLANARKSSRPEAAPSTSEQIEEQVNVESQIQAEQPETIEAPSSEALDPVMEAVEESNETEREQSFISSLLPATLKRKLQWNGDTAAVEENSANGAEQVVQPTEAWIEFPNDAVTLGPAAAPLEITPDVQSPVHSSANEIPPVTAEPGPIDQPSTFLPEEGSRMVESPSADLVQTLLARALFGSPETTEAVPQQNGADPFAPIPDSLPNNHLNAPEVVAFNQPVFEEQEEIPAEEPIAEIPSLPVGPETETAIDQQPLPKKHRSAKVRRFIAYEAVAVGIFLPLAVLGLLRLFRDPIMILVIDIITIAAAVAATLIPILFFAVAPRLPRGDE